MIKLPITQVLNSMNLKGTKFQLKVWNYLRKIPKGKVKTYLEVSKAIGKPRAFRAVANAIGKNPYPPQIPCHRVIRSDGSLGGYSGKGGIKKKRRLLEIEKVYFIKIFSDLNNCLFCLIPPFPEYPPKLPSDLITL